MHKCTLVMFLILLCSGCFSTPGKELSYQEMIDLVVVEGVPGIVLLVKTPDSQFVGVSGYADVKNNILMDTNQLFRIASMSKMFIGALTTMLHCEGVLSLDDCITDWLPSSITDNIQYADKIRLRDLLNHTSGIYDYGENEQFRNAVLTRAGKKWSAEEALSYAYGQPPYFEPGTNWYYSNTNYILAGLILDAALGYDHAHAVRTHILEPLQMNSTFYEHHEDVTGYIVHGYSDIDKDGLLDDVFLDQGYGLADAGFLSTVEDCAGFMEALFTNDDFPDAYKNEFMKEFLPGDDFYGLGIMKYPTEYGTGYGNGGHFSGYESGVMYFPDTDTTIIYFVNGTGPRLDRVMNEFFENILEKALSGLEKASQDFIPELSFRDEEIYFASLFTCY
jgi:D-alanyl-D-alanine carboxypeptidase